MNEHSESAVSTIIGAVLLVGITVTLGTAVYFMVPTADPPEIQNSAIRLDDRDGQYLESAGGDPLSTATTKILVETASGIQEFQLSTLGLGDSWDVGERVCVVGAEVGCLYPAGTQTSRITVVGGNQVLHSITTTGLSGSTTSSTAPSLSDLTVSFASATPTPSEGESSTFTFTITNGGSVTATGFTVQFDLDSVSYDSQLVASLAAGASTPLTVDYVSTAGLHDWLVTVDSLGAVTESNEGNNQATHSFTPGTPQPDLFGSYVSVTPAPREGQTSVFTFNITSGDVSSGPFDVRFDLDGVAQETQSIAGLLADETVQLQVNWDGVAGLQEWEMVIDSGSAIAESNESNNVVAESFTAAAAPVPVVVVDVPGDSLIAVAVGDLDGDGDDDVVAADVSGVLHVIRNDGGTLNPVSTTNAFLTGFIQIINIEGTSTPEVLISDYLGSRAVIYDVVGTNLVFNRALGSAGFVAGQLEAADHDNDGDMDIFIAVEEESGDDSGGVYLYENVAGVYGAPYRVSENGGPRTAFTLAVIDHLDGGLLDGYLEVVHGDFGNANGGEGGAKMDPAPSSNWDDENWIKGTKCSSYNFRWAHAMINGDAVEDLIFMCVDDGGNNDRGLVVSVAKTNGDYQGEEIEKFKDFAGGRPDRVIAVPIDYDQDGLMDLIVGDSNGYAYFYQQQAGFTFARSDDLFQGAGFYSFDGAAIDLEGDGEMEAVFVGYTGQLQIIDDMFR